MGHQGASSSTDRPRRTCIGCRRRSQQRGLVRFAVAGGAIVVDAEQRLPGRGAYLCRRTECATRVLTDGRRLAHALRTTRDRVTVDTVALLQDWNATRRDDGGDDPSDERPSRGLDPRDTRRSGSAGQMNNREATSAAPTERDDSAQRRVGDGT